MTSRGSVDERQTLRKVFRDEIKESRGDYYVIYHPADLRSPFASLQLIFPHHNADADVVRFMEDECELWLRRFCVPIVVTSFDAKDDVIRLAGVKTSSRLTGFIDLKAGVLVKKWELVADNELPVEQRDYGYLHRVYAAVPFRYQDEVVQKVRSEARFRGGFLKVFKLFAVLVVAVPVLVEVVSLGVGWLGHLLAAISILAGVLKISKALGWIKSSAREQAEEEKTRKMDHYYHHCELNPMKFRELVAENFERKSIEDTRKEAETLKVQLLKRKEASF